MTIEEDLDQVERGNIVRFTATFLAVDEPSAHPTSATLTIAFQNGTKIEKHAYQMTKGAGDVWTYDWDSSATSGGRVDTVAKSSGPVVGSKQKSILVLANEANKPST